METLGLWLAAAAAVGILAACEPPKGAPPPASPEGAVRPAAPTAATASAVPPVAPPSASTAAPSAPASKGNSTPVGASRFVEDAKQLGVSFTEPLELMAPPLKKKLMPLFVRSLGYESCWGCHVEGDFKSETRNLKIARQMWDRFVVGMRDQRGEPLFCDTCHAGKPKPLDRSDPPALKLFMEAEYQGKLTRADKRDNTCGACHGRTFEGRIFEKVWGIPAK